MSFFLVLLLSMLLGDAAWWVKTWRITRGVRRAWLWRLLASLFFSLQIAGLLAVIFNRFFGPVIAFLVEQPVISAVFIWHLLLLPLLSLIWLAAGYGSRLAGLVRKRTPVTAAQGVSRRNFLAISFATAPAIFTIGAVAAAQPQLTQFRTRRITISLPQLPPALDGLTIAHVSDLHVGRFTRGAVLREIVDATNALRTDLVLLAGDLINYDLADLPAALDVVKAMRATHGVFMCEGNHDLIENPRSFAERTRAAGVALLVNEAANLEVRGTPLQLLGAAWAHGDEGHREALRLLRAQRDPSAFPILLAHHPHAWDFAADIPLTLSGHTHGGQIMLTDRLGGGPAIFRYWSGVYRDEERALVVSNGVGNWFPLRVRAPAEIIHVTLRAG